MHYIYPQIYGNYKKYAYVFMKYCICKTQLVMSDIHFVIFILRITRVQ